MYAELGHIVLRAVTVSPVLRWSMTRLWSDGEGRLSGTRCPGGPNASGPPFPASSFDTASTASVGGRIYSSPSELPGWRIAILAIPSSMMPWEHFRHSGRGRVMQTSSVHVSSRSGVEPLFFHSFFRYFASGRCGGLNSRSKKRELTRIFRCGKPSRDPSPQFDLRRWPRIWRLLLSLGLRIGRELVC